MKRLYDDISIINGRGRTSSFYGEHRDTNAGRIPNVSFDMPINDLYGPHPRFGDTVKLNKN